MSPLAWEIHIYELYRIAIRYSRERVWSAPVEQYLGAPVDFHSLQENLRRLLLRRVRAGQLTGLQLARQAGFRQPHISNFLNSKRGLSLEALDRVLSVQHISILDLVDEVELSRRAGIVPPARDEFENVILVDAGLAAFLPRFTRDQVRDTFKINKSFLRHLRPKMEGDRAQWQRFIFLRASARDGMSMYPRLLPGAFMLVDRHYNSLLPYHPSERNSMPLCMKATATSAMSSRRALVSCCIPKIAATATSGCLWPASLPPSSSSAASAPSRSKPEEQAFGSQVTGVHL